MDEKTLFVENIKARVVENAMKYRGDSLQSSINCSLRFAREHAEYEDLDGKKGITSLIYEMNEFYVEMANRLRVLSEDFGRDEDDDDKKEAQFVEEDAASVFSEELVDSLQRYGDPDQIRNQIEEIRRLEEQVAHSFKQLEREKSERKLVENELCEMLMAEGVEDKDAQIFLRMCCARKTEKVQRTNKDEEKEEAADAAATTRRKGDFETKFIRRNMDLARNIRPMVSFSITDEEKIKLESLLSDLEIIEMAGETNARDAFAMGVVDSNRLEELELELNSLKVENDDCVQCCFEVIEENEREGKFWKTEQRLRKIDEELRSFQEEREKQQQQQIFESVEQEEEIDCEEDHQQKEEIRTADNDQQINN
ncbi:PREDICTED: trichohyalin-like [Nicrophorus vespilloides]|uniref:Trichohyalin-like n=1 Tax=Nicrophorus vespilloides TaxID=110193 RepID=A0ABM1M1W3_NICVS|nr:PREDICTED: trichohyalin-like [Nicrophorus vespilloides]